MDTNDRAPLQVVYTPEPITAAAELFEAVVGEAIAARGEAYVCISGGRTPLPLYAKLAAESDLAWDRVTFLFSDERFVPHTHPDSNYRSIDTAFLGRLPRPPRSVLAWPILGTLSESAAAYARSIDELGARGQLFDFTLLGIGADGHTASLFPGTGAALETGSTVAREVPSIGRRLSLSAPALSDSRVVAFLVTGADKADALRLNFPAAFGGTPDSQAAMDTPDAAPASAITATERLLLVTDSLEPVT
ncbi:MAG: 6-phosphogluconolactonase [Trueperaceae bacterium]|nr:6-phosphogluconolactonase [Trueperaceae bacterium]